MARFEDRISAAGELLPGLQKYTDSNAVVVGLPRGGVVTASFLAKKLKLPLDFIIVKKVGAPGNSELAVGAVTESDQEYSDDEFEQKRKEALERGRLYRKNYPAKSLKDKVVILADDGVATGATMLAAIGVVKRKGAKRVVVAIPVASTDAAGKIKSLSDEFVCLMADPDMSAVGEYYNSFPQVEDGEVLAILENAKDNFFNK